MAPFKPRLSALAAIGLVALIASVALPAQADTMIQNSSDFARVLHVVPMGGMQTPREVCRSYPSHYEGRHGDRYDNRSNTGAVLGGLGGALVGSRFGDGNGKVAATIAGTIGGALIGDRYDNNGRDERGRFESAPARQCETVYENSGPPRYQVTYDYQGQRGTVIMNRDPGEWLRLRRIVTIE